MQVPSSSFTYLLLMHLVITSTKFLYMCCFKYIFCTFFLPSTPICFLANWFLSKNRRFCARTSFPGCPTGWRRPVTLFSTISRVPPASVPRTYSTKMKIWGHKTHRNYQLLSPNKLTQRSTENIINPKFPTLDPSPIAAFLRAKNVIRRHCLLL